MEPGRPSVHRILPHSPPKKDSWTCAELLANIRRKRKTGMEPGFSRVESLAATLGGLGLRYSGPSEENH